MPWWALPLCHLQSWTLHSWLSRTGLAEWYCIELVSKVSFTIGWWLLRILLSLCSSRCDSMPTNLDQPGSHWRTHEKTDFLLWNFDPGILWDDFGIRSDIVVSFLSRYLPNLHWNTSLAIYSLFLARQHSQTPGTWSVAPTHQRSLQESSDWMGWRVSCYDSWTCRRIRDYWRHRSSVQFD